MKKNKFILNGMDGVSLISVLVAIAFTGVLAKIMTTLWTNSMKSQRHLALKGDIESVREYVKGRLDCTATLTPMPTCSATNPLTLDKIGGGTLTDSTGLLYGDNYLSAYCDSTAGTLVIKFAKKDSSGSFKTDPITDMTLDWSHPATQIFGAAKPICYEMFSSSSTSSANQSVKIVRVPMSAVVFGTTHMMGTATCPAGYYVSGGGSDCRRAAASNIWFSDAPNTTNGWISQCYYAFGTVLGVYGTASLPALTTYAICMKASAE